MILDLSTSEMQKSSNIILEGIAESVVNPSTHFWNAIYPILMADSERPNGKVGEYRYNLRIVTTSSDQPAKRSLFGFRAHHSSLSCFYCMAPGTFYKTEGAARHEARPGKLTIEDSKYGRNGFSNIPSKLIERILPFENPIDILHDAGEGLFNAIMTEMFGNKTRTAKSTLFSVDSDAIKHSFSEVTVPTLFNEIHNCRNGTDKINFFRLIVCCSAIQSTLLSPKARFVCVSLACVTNKMYTNAKSDGLFDVQLCAAARWFLKEASEEYMTCKAHEFIYHLPYSNQKFGNSASLSTFCFESSYQYNLMGYSSRLTRNFCETACSRVLLHNTVRREIVRRAENNPSRRLQKFLSATTGIVKHVTNWQTPIGSLKEEDIHIELTGRNLYSTLSLSFGTLRSEYFNRDTPDDLFFASQDGDVFTCFRFIACGMKNKGAFVLAEPLEEIPISEQFDSLHDALQTLSGTDYYYGQEVLKMMQSYEGIKYCSQTGKREIIPIDTIISVACYIPCSNGYCVVAINGSPIHN